MEKYEQSEIAFIYIFATLDFAQRSVHANKVSNDTDTNMKNHQLKTHTQYFEEIWNRKKLFEVRNDDRNYEVGDTLTLLDYNPNTETYNRRTISAEISYKLGGGSFGVEKGFCVLSLTKISNWNLDEEGLPHFCS